MSPYAVLPAAFWVAYGVFIALCAALMLVSMWKIFVKMGIPGWKSIIPYYNLWTMIDRLGKPRSWFWIVVLCAIVYMACYGVLLASILGGALTTPVDHFSQIVPVLLAGLVAFAVAIVMLVYTIMIYHALSKGFGHDAGFTAGLILLTIVFLPILAFGPSRFQLAK